MIKEYSKIRFLLFSAQVIIMFIFIFLSGVNIIRLILSPFTLFFVGTILFALNKKKTDYISFAIFTFGLVGSFTFFVNWWAVHLYESSYIYWYLMNNKLEFLFLIVSGLILTYLISRFFRIKNRK